MSNEDETTTNEKKEQIEPVAESPENFKEVVEDQDIGVEKKITEVERVGDVEINSVKQADGLPEEVEEMKNVVDEATEEAKETKEKYEEDLKNIPNFDDKVEAIKKGDEAREEYNEKLKDIPNAGDLAESFKTEEIAKETAEEVKSEESPVVEVKIEKTDGNPEKEKSCQKCGAIFPGTANFCGKCGTELEKTETAEPKVEKVSEIQQPKATKSENLENRQIFDRLSKFNVSIEAINMEDKKAAIEKISEAYSNLKVFISNNKEVIDNNKELETLANAIGKILIEAVEIIEGNGDQVEKSSDFETKTENSGVENVRKDKEDPSSEENDERLAKEVWLKRQEEKGNKDTVAANFIREELERSEPTENKGAIEAVEIKEKLDFFKKTAEKIHLSNKDGAKNYEDLSMDLDDVHSLLRRLSQEINSNIPEKGKTREFLVGIANKIMKERSLKHEEYLKNRKDEVWNKKTEGSVNTTEDLDSNRNEDRSENNENETKVIDKGIMMKVTADIPSGEHWKTETLMKSNIRVKAGSKLTITGTIMKSSITVEKGGILETSKGFVNMKSEIIYEK